MRYVIRKVPERNTAYLERLLPNPLIVCDAGHNGALYSMNMAFKMANDDAVYIQDDMLLCRDFARRAEAVIEKHRNSIIVFANNTSEGNPMIDREGYYPIRDVRWLMCTYVPNRLRELYLRQIKSGEYRPSAHDIKYQLDDNVFTKWAKSINEDGYLTVPNLAGHPSNKSTINGRMHPEVCTNFDYASAEPRLEGEAK